MEHIDVYRQRSRYAGWPANYGIWSWGNEIVVGFTVGYPDPRGGFHARDRSRPFTAMQARSLDGGRTWQVQDTPCRIPEGYGLSVDEHVHAGLYDRHGDSSEEGFLDPTDEVAFTHPDFAFMCARSGLVAGAQSWYYYSYSRCRTWNGPFLLPMFGQSGIAARTDYSVSGPAECTLFLTATKSDGREGRVFCSRTTDGGRTFRFLSWVGQEPAGFTIMPASVRLSDARIVAAVRCRSTEADTTHEQNWIDLYASDDDAKTWHYVTRPVENTGMGGNPPALIRLADGRLCLVYGFRDKTYGIRATLSSDEGVTWSRETILRADGGNHDLGYPRAVQRPDGAVVVVYYFNRQADAERYIAATIWQP